MDKIHIYQKRHDDSIMNSAKAVLVPLDTAYSNANAALKALKQSIKDNVLPAGEYVIARTIKAVNIATPTQTVVDVTFGKVEAKPKAKRTRKPKAPAIPDSSADPGTEGE